MDNHDMEPIVKLTVNPCPVCGVAESFVVRASANSCFFDGIKVFLFGCESPGCTSTAWFPFPLDEAAPNYGKMEGLREKFEVPLQMVTDFKEALACYLHGYYNASAVMARRVLERILLEKGAKPGQRICDMIKDLSSRGIIDNELRGLCDEIKYFGNVGAHVKIEEANESDAQTALQFSEFLVSWLLGQVERKPVRL